MPKPPKYFEGIPVGRLATGHHPRATGWPVLFFEVTPVAATAENDDGDKLSATVDADLAV